MTTVQYVHPCHLWSRWSASPYGGQLSSLLSRSAFVLLNLFDMLYFTSSWLQLTASLLCPYGSLTTLSFPFCLPFPSCIPFGRTAALRASYRPRLAWLSSSDEYVLKSNHTYL